MDECKVIKKFNINKRMKKYNYEDLLIKNNSYRNNDKLIY